MPTPYQTAAILIIGNEVLSGRTREANAWYAAKNLFDQGCKLGEVAIIADVHDDIVMALQRLSDRYDVVITSGGIGPTHDDITMQAVADCFAVRLLEHAETMQKLYERFGQDVDSGRRRMARLPETSKPIVCSASLMPGAHIRNVYVLAGVPSIFASQLDSFLDRFGGRPFIRKEIDVYMAESRFASALADIQEQFNDVEIGSYPMMCADHPCGKICLSSQHENHLDDAFEAVQTMIQGFL
ncbi:MAG: competence/damage-inducible protein A [Zetaproteobacteria bacterium]|nr:competence/damage-inducible protein A [Zetaproteobacteria bacterium]